MRGRRERRRGRAKGVKDESERKGWGEEVIGDRKKMRRGKENG